MEALLLDSTVTRCVAALLDWNVTVCFQPCQSLGLKGFGENREMADYAKRHSFFLLSEMTGKLSQVTGLGMPRYWGSVALSCLPAALRKRATGALHFIAATNRSKMQ